MISTGQTRYLQAKSTTTLSSNYKRNVEGLRSSLIYQTSIKEEKENKMWLMRECYVGIITSRKTIFLYKILFFAKSRRI